MMKRDDHFYAPTGKDSNRKERKAICLACSRQRHRMIDAVRRKPVWEFIKSHKDGKSCHDCGIDWPYYVLEFDHRDPTEKSFTVSVMINSHWREEKWPIIAEEIGKCDLVCRNCHVIRGHGRGNRGAKRKYHPSDEDIEVCSGLSANTSPVAPREVIVLREIEGSVPEPPSIQQLSLFDLD